MIAISMAMSVARVSSVSSLSSPGPIRSTRLLPFALYIQLARLNCSRVVHQPELSDTIPLCWVSTPAPDSR